MEYKIEDLGAGNFEVRIDGRFTFADNPEFKRILGIISDNSTNKLTLNLNGLTFIDSAALGMFLIARESAEENNTEIVIKDINNEVEKMFSISKFYDLFTII